MSNIELKQFVENNPKLVTRKQSKTHPELFVLKYKNSVFFDNLWHKSSYLLDCRGLVVDADYNIIVQPFTKIFNYRENSAGYTWRDDDIVFVTRKVNGFMASLTNVNGKLIVSTTGSLDSDFVGYAKEHLMNITPDMIKPGYTYMFEICHVLDPHIIPEKLGAHFLAVVEHGGQTYYKFDGFKVIFDVVTVFGSIGIHTDDEPTAWTFGELKSRIKNITHEGYVIVNARNDETIKIKSPYYLVNKFFARVGEKSLVVGIRTGTVKQRIDEEYYPIVDTLKAYGLDKFTQLHEQERLNLLRSWISELQQ